MEYIIALGSSVSAHYLKKATSLLKAKENFGFLAISRIYENKSLGMSPTRLCFNAAVALRSELEPHALYRELKTIEQAQGRIRSYTNAPRTLDIDVLLSMQFSYTSESFFIPHKEFFRRSFFVSCAIEVIQSVGWPTPFSLYQANLRQGTSLLIPCKEW